MEPDKPPQIKPTKESQTKEESISQFHPITIENIEAVGKDRNSVKYTLKWKPDGNELKNKVIGFLHIIKSFRAVIHLDKIQNQPVLEKLILSFEQESKKDLVDSDSKSIKEAITDLSDDELKKLDKEAISIQINTFKAKSSEGWVIDKPGQAESDGLLNHVKVYDEKGKCLVTGDFFKDEIGVAIPRSTEDNLLCLQYDTFKTYMVMTEDAEKIKKGVSNEISERGYDSYACEIQTNVKTTQDISDNWQIVPPNTKAVFSGKTPEPNKVEWGFLSFIKKENGVVTLNVAIVLDDKDKFSPKKNCITQETYSNEVKDCIKENVIMYRYDGSITDKIREEERNSMCSKRQEESKEENDKCPIF